MRWDARGTAALLVSALVGVTAGVIVGFTTGSSPPSNAGPDDKPSSSPSASGSATDPLGLGAPLENIDCNGKTILVVGWGETRGALTNAVEYNRDADVKYLEVAKSCNTLYGAERQAPPTYAVYLGPFDSTNEPCALRMSIDHSRDVVTSLKPGVKIHVQCLCSVEPAAMPELNVGMAADTRDGIYIRALQRLLVDMGLKPGPITGEYNPRTAAVVKRLQRVNAIDPELYGLVEAQTWRLLRDRGCLNYDF
jgi:Putative peptidoglycan binding domain